jgi:hypothetical protein
VTTSIAGRVPLVVAVILIALIAGAIVGACSSDDPVPRPPQAFIEATVASGAALSPICRDVAATRKSLESAVTAVLRFDEEGLQDATRASRESIENLSTSAASTGQAHQVDNLKADIAKLEQLLGQPGVSWSGTEVTNQIRWIADDLSAIENTAGCPA